MIVIMTGLPGTGKTTLAHALVEKTAGAMLNKDDVRSALFSAADIEYSTEQDNFCMAVLLEAACFLLEKNPKRIVYIDGRPFSKAAQLQQVLEVAGQLKQEWRILECICSEETARTRLKESAMEHPAANRNYDLYLRIKSSWQNITLTKTLIDTERPLAECIAAALAAIGRVADV